MNKEILPIGSVVNISKESNIKFMIVGYFPTNHDGEQRDYSAVRYPMGVYDNRMYFFFNHCDINNVFYTGYQDKEFIIMTELINTHKGQIHRDGEQNG